MYRIGFAAVGLLLACAGVACTQESAPAPSQAAVQEEPEEAEGDLVAVIETEKGDIVVRLLPQEAPRTVKEFVRLARLGFYTRTTFHYVSPGFIWGGDPFSRDNDPYNDGLGNTGKWIGAEFSPEHKVKKGCVGMMRRDDNPDGSSCQFFICLKRKPSWDGKYNIFGDVIEGIEVAEAISRVPRVKHNSKLANRPAGKQIIKHIRIEHRKLEPEKAEKKA